MDVIFLLIPISLVLIAVIIYFLFWAIRSGQFDDLEGSAYEILMDDDKDTISAEDPAETVKSESEEIPK